MPECKAQDGASGRQPYWPYPVAKDGDLGGPALFAKTLDRDNGWNNAITSLRRGEGDFTREDVWAAAATQLATGRRKKLDEYFSGLPGYATGGIGVVLYNYRNQPENIATVNELVLTANREAALAGKQYLDVMAALRELPPARTRGLR